MDIGLLHRSAFVDRSGFTVAEVEPLGIYQFAPDSRQLVIAEDIQTITLYVQKLYGSRSNTTHLSYTTSGGSAAPGEDFLAVSAGLLVFDSPQQMNASFRLSVIDDALSEPDEYFYVNLTHVEILTPNSTRTDSPPRINPQHRVAAVTILASDATGGVLSIGPELVRVKEDREEANQQEQKVVLRVRRSDGIAGTVSVRVQAYGGRFSFTVANINPHLVCNFPQTCAVVLLRWKYHSSSLHFGTYQGSRKGRAGLPLGVHCSISASWRGRDGSCPHNPG